MEGWLLSLGMVASGGGLAYMIYQSTGENREYPVGWWVAWGLLAGGILLALANLAGQRTSYVIWSAVLAMIAGAGSLLAGKKEDEYHPLAWVSAGTLLSSGLVFGLGTFLPSGGVAVLISLLGMGLFVTGWVLRAADRHLYDAAFTCGTLLVIVALMLAFHALRSPLEQLNEVDLPRARAALSEAREKAGAYSEARAQADSCRGAILAEFAGDNAAYSDIADGHIRKAEEQQQAANAALSQAGALPAVPYKEWSSVEVERVRTAFAGAREANTQSERALKELGEVCKLQRELASEYKRTFLWFEVDAYWPSEDSDTNYPACYYGETVSRVAEDGSVAETIISDEADMSSSAGSWFGSDVEHVNWKIFTVQDYVEMVNAGLIPPMSTSNPTLSEVGNYLCGSNPQGGQYGVLDEPPVSFVKERGTTMMELEDDEDTFVGNYRYGGWCVADENGKYHIIPENEEPPENAEWCWHQPQGRSTGYYWILRLLDGGRYVFDQGPRRCVYCTPRDWTGDEAVPAGRIAEANGTDAPNVRGPSDIGGGPGSGK